MVTFATLASVQSFITTHCLSYMNRQAICRSTSTRLFVTSPDADSSDGYSSRKVELWLDLRENSILPTAAIEFLRENLSEDDVDSPSLQIDIDRILVATNDAQAYQEISDEDFIQPDLLYVSKDNDSEFLSTKDGVTESFAEIVVMEGSAGVQNPFKVIQTLSSGKWVVLVQSGDESEVEDSMMDIVGDFLEIASNSVSTNWVAAPTSDSQGLLVPLSPEMEKEMTGAGVAIRCSSPSSIMQLASTIELAGSGMSTTILDSGILIQDDIMESDLPIALVLPFDIPIWRLANTLYRNGNAI